MCGSDGNNYWDLRHMGCGLIHILTFEGDLHSVAVGCSVYISQEHAASSSRSKGLGTESD
jgi:hypothetical protein